MELYTYWRSSAAYRVRIALALKQLDHQSIPVHLVKDGGEQHSADYQRINPQQLVPALRLDSGVALSQSLAIIEYLEERYPEPALLPSNLEARARVRSLAQHVACDIHPLNNLRVLLYLTNTGELTDHQKQHWYQHWIETGFASLERELAGSSATGVFCHGDTPGIADCFLVPQVYNARRFSVDLAAYPTIVRIDRACQDLPAFQLAAPEAQADAVEVK